MQPETTTKSVSYMHHVTNCLVRQSVQAYLQFWKYAVNKLEQRSSRCLISVQLFMSRAVRCGKAKATSRTPDSPSFRLCSAAESSRQGSVCYERDLGLAMTQVVKRTGAAAADMVIMLTFTFIRSSAHVFYRGGLS